MDGMLSQDEINALLNGGGDSDSGDDSSAGASSTADIDDSLILKETRLEKLPISAWALPLQHYFLLLIKR